MKEEKKLAVTYRKVDDLIPYARNARTHSPEQVARIASSIKEFGWTNPILTDGENGIIAGHGRLAAARKLGLTEVPTIELSGLSDTQKRAYILADNKLALDAGWDNELLGLELADLKELDVNLDLTGFSEIEIADLIPGECGGGQDDEASVPEEKHSLNGDFIIPPFSIFDASASYWQERKKQWLSLGIKSEVGRKVGLLLASSAQPGYIYNKKAEFEKKNRADVDGE